MTVLDIAEFYGGTLGKVTRELIYAKLGPSAQPRPDQLLVGLGYALPYLSAEARTVAFMMARSGVLRWPQTGKVRSALVDELDLPLGDNMVDVAMLVHALEFAESAEDMLAEVWRVLSPQGKLLLVVPNRGGLWATSDASPFGRGQPFSRAQIGALLRQAQFSINRIEYALALPPWGGPGLARGVEFASRLGLRRFSGIMMIEAQKQVYSYSTGKVARRAFPRFRPVLLPRPQTASKS